jgi:hypothetical protein
LEADDQKTTALAGGSTGLLQFQGPLELRQIPENGTAAGRPKIAPPKPSSQQPDCWNARLSGGICIGRRVADEHSGRGLYTQAPQRKLDQISMGLAMRGVIATRVMVDELLYMSNTEIMGKLTPAAICCESNLTAGFPDQT